MWEKLPTEIQILGTKFQKYVKDSIHDKLVFKIVIRLLSFHVFLLITCTVIHMFHYISNLDLFMSFTLSYTVLMVFTDFPGRPCLYCEKET